MAGGAPSLVRLRLFVVRGLTVLAALTLLGGLHGPALGSRLEQREEDHELGVDLDTDAVDARLPAPAVSRREVRAGERVTIHWGRVPPRVEEFELILSLDGGRTWDLRMSREMEGERTREVWDVPNLSAADARIRIRARIDGRETWGPESRPFRIVFDQNRPRERWLFWESPRWDQLAGAARAESRLSTGPAGPSLHAGRPLVAAEAPIRVLAPPPAIGARPWTLEASLRPGATPTPPPASAQETHPLRE